MCLAIPGKIIRINDSVPGLRMAKVDFGGMKKDVCIQWVDVGVGEYILAHAGMAIATVNEEYAKETLADFERLAKPEENE